MDFLLILPEGFHFCLETVIGHWSRSERQRWSHESYTEIESFIMREKIAPRASFRRCSTYLLWLISTTACPAPRESLHPQFWAYRSFSTCLFIAEIIFSSMRQSPDQSVTVRNTSTTKYFYQRKARNQCILHGDFLAARPF